MATTIRNLDARLYRALLARAKARNRTVGSQANEAFRAFLSRPRLAGSSRRSFLDFKPVDFGPGTENVSEQIDQILYGENE